MIWLISLRDYRSLCWIIKVIDHFAAWSRWLITFLHDQGNWSLCLIINTWKLLSVWIKYPCPYHLLETPSETLQLVSLFISTNFGSSAMRMVLPLGVMIKDFAERSITVGGQVYWALDWKSEGLGFDSQCWSCVRNFTQLLCEISYTWPALGIKPQTLQVEIKET